LVGAACSARAGSSEWKTTIWGDTESVGGGVSEMHIDHGPGYRVYFTRRSETIYLLLCGSDKSTQVRDIRTAKRLAQET
jgi:putative addiction module killer protein